jgi:hypothetical protein
MEQALPGWFSADELLFHRMESFHRERVREIGAGEAPFRMKAGGAIILHLIPTISVLAPRRFTGAELKEHGQRILPPGQSSCLSRFNADGLANHDGKPESRAYAQVWFIRPKRAPSLY